MEIDPKLLQYKTVLAVTKIIEKVFPDHPVSIVSQTLDGTHLHIEATGWEISFQTDDDTGNLRVAAHCTDWFQQ